MQLGVQRAARRASAEWLVAVDNSPGRQASLQLQLQHADLLCHRPIRIWPSHFVYAQLDSSHTIILFICLVELV
jgi:hypothetical protein